MIQKCIPWYLLWQGENFGGVFAVGSLVMTSLGETASRYIFLLHRTFCLMMVVQSNVPWTLGTSQKTVMEKLPAAYQCTGNMQLLICTTVPPSWECRSRCGVGKRWGRETRHPHAAQANFIPAFPSKRRKLQTKIGVVCVWPALEFNKNLPVLFYSPLKTFPQLSEKLFPSSLFQLLQQRIRNTNFFFFWPTCVGKNIFVSKRQIFVLASLWEG